MEPALPPGVAPIEASRAVPLPQVKAASPRNVLLISVDTLRPDHLSLYGYHRPTTPALDSFFSRAEIYERAYSAEANTSPSVITMLSGLYPSRHHLRLLYQRIDPEVHLLSDHLSAAGFQTAAVVSNLVLTAEAIGLSTRFEHYDDFVDEREQRRSVHERRASRTTDAAVRWLLNERDPGRPHFLWVHYNDPHGPYTPPSSETPLDFQHGSSAPFDAEKVLPYQRLEGVEDGNEYVDRYDEEIAYTDREIGRLLRVYRKYGLDEDAVVIFTADHGETMLEHELWFNHGFHVWESIMRVPLAIRRPERGAGRLATPVSLVDLMPTVLSEVGLSVPSGLDGKPMAERTPQDALSFEASGWGPQQHRAMLVDHRKWFYTIDLEGRRRARWYLDVGSDPLELTPKPWVEDPRTTQLDAWWREDPDPAGRPRELLEGMRLRVPKVAPGRTEEQLEALRTLGYVP